MPSLGTSSGQDFLAALLDLDPAGAGAALRRAVETHPNIVVAYEASITPALRQLGDLRAHGECEDQDVRDAATIARAALNTVPSPVERHRARALVTTLDAHDLGAHCVATALRVRGWTVELLGAPLPSEVVEYTAHLRPDLVAISVSQIELLATAQTLTGELRALPAPPHVRVGGAAVPHRVLNLR